MNNAKACRTVAAMLATGAMCATMAVAPFSPMVERVEAANAYSKLLNAQNKKAASAQREAQLRSQLAGVKSDLADKIVELDELTNTKIPAAQAAVEQANADAASAQSEAEAAASRLEAAQKDKANLEAQIEQTGKDYDDAHAAVAQMAREDLHGSDASTVMSVVTGATSTQEFINSMQSRDALSRTESNAATDAANTLNTSMNRGERLAAIEKQIAKLKSTADEKAASAQQAAADAQSQRDALDQLRAEGEDAPCKPGKPAIGIEGKRGPAGRADRAAAIAGRFLQPPVRRGAGGSRKSDEQRKPGADQAEHQRKQQAEYGRKQQFEHEQRWRHSGADPHPDPHPDAHARQQYGSGNVER